MADGGDYVVVSKKKRRADKQVEQPRTRHAVTYMQTSKIKELDFKRFPAMDEDGVIGGPGKQKDMMSVWMMEQLEYFVRGTNDDFSFPDKGLMMDLDPEDPVYKELGFEYCPEIEFETIDQTGTKVKEDCVAIIDNGARVKLICGVTTPVPLMLKYMGRLGGLAGTGLLGQGGISDAELPDTVASGTYHPCYDAVYTHTVVPCLLNAVNLVVSPQPKPLLCVIWEFDMESKRLVSVSHRNIVGCVRGAYDITDGGMDHLNMLLEIIKDDILNTHGCVLNLGYWAWTHPEVSQMATLIAFTRLEWTRLLIDYPEISRVMTKTARQTRSDFRKWVNDHQDCTVVHRHLSMMSGWCSREADIDDPMRKRKMIGWVCEQEVSCTVNKPFACATNLANQVEYLGVRKLMDIWQANGFEHFASLGNGLGKPARIVGRSLPRKNSQKMIKMDVTGLVDSHLKCVSWSCDYPQLTRTGDFMSLRTDMTSDLPGACPFPSLAKHLPDMKYENGAIMIFKGTVTVPQVCHWDLFENVCKELVVKEILAVIPV